MIFYKVVLELKRKQTIIDLYLFITRDYIVLYYSSKELVNKTCFVNNYSKKIKK